MAPKPPTDEEYQAAVNAVARHGGNISAAARSLPLDRNTLTSRLEAAKRKGFKANVGREEVPQAPPPPSGPLVDAGDAVLAQIRRTPSTLEEIATKLHITKGQALDAIDALKERGSHILLRGDRYVISLAPEPSFIRGGELPTYHSRPDGTYVFGATGDNHIASKYSRLDVLNELYDIYEEEGVDRVFNTGNWIDGEASFNQHDLLVHGMDNQLRALAKDYPHRPGIETYAVAGDDHEGWYAQKFGIDIGMRAQHTMRDAGRTDWHNLGYMEAPIRLVHSQSGAESILSVVHPGGGSSYAVSYSIQKIIESLDGGEKPAVGLYGHYHKLWAGNIRNVWCVQTGTTEDQTPFMRKKKLEAHVGGTLLKLRQDPRSGAITRCSVELLRFFNKGFYGNRWNHGGEVVHAERAP